VLKLRYYIQLTKPTIMVLVLFTGAVALIIEGSMLNHPVQFMLILFGLYLTGGGANALNQCFERERDGQMERTKHRRPLPTGKLTPTEAFVFSILISVFGVVMFAWAFNWASAFISLATVLFYSLFYTILLKPNTAQNIVIGGAAGAMAPIIAWVAASGTLTFAPVLMFLIIFFWTPPHFWALALYYKKDYISVDLPMMPVVKGDASTMNQILFYTVLLVLSSLAMTWYVPGFFYLAATIISGVFIIRKTLQTRQRLLRSDYFGLFKYSLIHLFVIFLAISLDRHLF
jgi:heme o synthase